MERKTKQELGDDRAKVYETLGPWLERHQPKIEYPKIQTIVKQLCANKDHSWRCWSLLGWLRYRVSLPRRCGSLCRGRCCPSPSPGQSSEDYEKIAKPFSIQVGDLDDFLPRPDQEKVAEIFKNKKDCEIVIHEDQMHGFGSRGDLSIEKDRKAKELCVENVFQFRLVSDGLDDQLFETLYEVIADIVSLWKLVQIWQFV
jgi:hypothetical protein